MTIAQQAAFDRLRDRFLARGLSEEDSISLAENTISAWPHFNLEETPHPMTIYPEILDDIRETLGHPGKFEGEPASTILAYHVALNGMSDDDITDLDDRRYDFVSFARPEQEILRAEFGDDAVASIIWETDAGFVCSHRFLDMGLAESAWHDLCSEIEAEYLEY